MPGTPTLRYDVANLDQWGRLIKSWATHLDYVSAPDAPQPPRDYIANKTWSHLKPSAKSTTLDTDAEGNKKPWCLPSGSAVLVPDADGGAVALPFAVAMTVEQFTTRVAAAGVSITTMPAQYKHVIIVQGTVGTMVMRLPPKDTLQGSEDDLLSGSLTYPIRPFYSQLYGGPPKPPTDPVGIMELHANRIGEYTLNNCT
jgi:hypothetical protein